MWSSIVAALSEHRHVCALDTIGDVGKSVLADPDRYPKKGRDYSAWLDDVFTGLSVTAADMVGGSMGGWIGMNHAIYAPDRLRRLVLHGPMGFAPWRATHGVLGPFMSQRLRPTAAKLDAIITRSLGEGERVNREFRPWMRIMGYTKARVGQPFHIPARKLRNISAPTLLFLGGKDGLVGSVSAAARRARRNITGCEIEVVPDAGHVMSSTSRTSSAPASSSSCADGRRVRGAAREEAIADAWTTSAGLAAARDERLRRRPRNSHCLRRSIRDLRLCSARPVCPHDEGENRGSGRHDVCCDFTSRCAAVEGGSVSFGAASRRLAVHHADNTHVEVLWGVIEVMPFAALRTRCGIAGLGEQYLHQQLFI